MTASTRRRAPQIGRRTTIAAAVAAITGFVAATGTPPALAAWSATAAATATVGAPAVSLTHAGFDTLSTTFGHADMDHRGGFTITNTGDIAGTTNLTVTASGDLATHTNVSVWAAHDLAACQQPTPDTAVHGTWADFPHLDLPTLDSAASLTVCVRSWAHAGALSSEGGSQSFSASATTTLSVSAWTASTPPVTATVSTEFLYPLATGYAVDGINNWFVIGSVADPTQCVDSFSRGTHLGNTIGIWACSNAPNQRFEIPATQDGKSALRPKSAAEHRVGQVNALTVHAAPGTAGTDWRVEQVAPARFQLVHSDTGLCLTVPGRNIQTQVLRCDGSASQQFTLTRELLTCATDEATMTLNYNAPAGNRSYTTQYRAAGGAWSDAYTEQSWGVSRSTFSTSVFGETNATLDLRVIDSVGNIIYGGMTIDVTETGVTCGTGFGS